MQELNMLMQNQALLPQRRQLREHCRLSDSCDPIGDGAGGLRLQPGSLLPQRCQLREHRWFPDPRDTSPIRAGDFRLQPSSLLPQRRQLREHRWVPDPRYAVAIGDRAAGLRLQPGPLLPGECNRDRLGPKIQLADDDGRTAPPVSAPLVP